MPIYEYQTLDPEGACDTCRNGFEILQMINDKPLSTCPACGKKVKKIISWCHAAVMDTSDEYASMEKKLKSYENEGMWSHAAELADIHSEKTKDPGLKMRALDNYKKAGYSVDSLEKHIKTDNE